MNSSGGKYSFLMTYRYLFCFIIFIILVFFKIHMSSIGMYDHYITDTINNYQLFSTDIFNSAQPIRSDEWIHSTPTFLSQAMVTESFFPAFHNGLSMTLELYPPVFDFTALGKPLNWGFFIFGNELGLSWLWSMKLILLFILSFEMGMILSERQPFWGVILGCLVAFSPAIQWWFFPHFVEPVLYSEWLIVCFYYFLTSSKKYLKIICSIFFGMGIIGFCLSIYPGLQVPLGYIVILFSAYLFFSNREKSRVIPIKFWVIYMLSIILAFAIIIDFLFKNIEYLNLFSNTEYPGKRFSMGGKLPWFYIYHEFLNIFTPFKEQGLHTNQCEVSSFFILFPLPFFAYFWTKIKENMISLVRILFFAYIIIMFWMFIGVPEAFAKYSLLSYMTEPRAFIIVFGLISTYYMISILANKQLCKNSKNEIYNKWVFFLLYTTLLVSALSSQIFSGYLTPAMRLVILLVFIPLAYLFVFGSSKVFAISLSSICIFSGIMVNPVASGISPIMDKQFSAIVLEINEKEKGEWIAEGFVPTQLLVALGVDVFNRKRLYPLYDKFKLLDPDEKYKSIYNRTAGMGVNILPNGILDFAIERPSYIVMSIPTNDLLEKTDIKYAVTAKKMTQPCYEKIWKAPSQDIYIYKVNREILDINHFGIGKDSKTDYYLDTANNLIFDEQIRNNIIEIPLNEKKISFRGWSIDSENESLSAGVIFIVDEEKLFFSDIEHQRDDVALHFKDNRYKMSGFNVEIPLNNLAVGRHKIQMIILSSSGKGYYNAREFFINIH